MKKIYKEPMLYYILVPIIAALWPLFVGGIYLPRAERELENGIKQYRAAEKVIEAILTLDPARLEFSGSAKSADEFDYAIVVEKVAGLCKIPSTSYRLSSGRITTTKGQKSQSAKVILKDVDITRVARFLSAIQLRWSDLQCIRLKLTRKKGLPDTWDADIDFKYYY